MNTVSPGFTLLGNSRNSVCSIAARVAPSFVSRITSSTSPCCSSACLNCSASLWHPCNCGMSLLWYWLMPMHTAIRFGSRSSGSSAQVVISIRSSAHLSCDCSLIRASIFFRSSTFNSVGPCCSRFSKSSTRSIVATATRSSLPKGGQVSNSKFAFLSGTSTLVLAATKLL